MALRGSNTAKLGRNNGGAVPFVLTCRTDASTSSYVLQRGKYNKLKKFRVIRAWGVMIGAGAASDTVKLTDGTNDISNTVDVSALSDKAVFDFDTLDDAYYEIGTAETLTLVTASGALCEVHVMCLQAA